MPSDNEHTIIVDFDNWEVHTCDSQEIFNDKMEKIASNNHDWRNEIEVYHSESPIVEAEVVQGFSVRVSKKK